MVMVKVKVEKPADLILQCDHLLEDLRMAA
jgi:hypothetical protein